MKDYIINTFLGIISLSVGLLILIHPFFIGFILLKILNQPLLHSVDSALEFWVIGFLFEGLVWFIGTQLQEIGKMIRKKSNK